MDRAASELFLAALFVEPSPERLAALKSASEAARNWEGLLGALEGHGVLALFLRTLELAGLDLPPAVAPTFRSRAGREGDGHQRSRLTLQRFLAAASRSGVELTLVGSSALCHDLYEAPLRRAGEYDVLVAPEHWNDALRAAEEAGLFQAESALPSWWYARTGSPFTLVPASPFLRAVHLRSVLHHPSLLLTAREPDLVSRRRRLPFEGHPLFLLDPYDALLEVCVSLASRAGEALLLSGRRNLLAAASDGGHPLRLDCLLDVRTLIERSHATLAPVFLIERAREWGAEPALAAVLECLQMGLGFLPAAREWTRQVARTLAGRRPAAGQPAPALFRPDPIERLPRWLAPSDDYLRARFALPRAAGVQTVRLARARHLAQVAGAALVAGLGLPLALLGHRLQRKTRKLRIDEAQSAQGAGEVGEAFRAAARVEQQKPIAPQSIRLSEEESIARFPDRYDG